MSAVLAASVFRQIQDFLMLEKLWINFISLFVYMLEHHCLCIFGYDCSASYPKFGLLQFHVILFLWLGSLFADSMVNGFSLVVRWLIKVSHKCHWWAQSLSVPVMAFNYGTTFTRYLAGGKEREWAHHPHCRQVKGAPAEVDSPAIRNPESFGETWQNVGFSNNGWNTGISSRPEQEKSLKYLLSLGEVTAWN